MKSITVIFFLICSYLFTSDCFSLSRSSPSKSYPRELFMAVNNDANAKANRAARSVDGNTRTAEILLPLGMELDEDKEGNVFVKSMEPNGRAARTGKVFVGDRITMVSATFGEDMWSTRGVGLTRVLSAMKVRNSKPVKFALEATTEAEEKKRRAIAFAELSETEKAKKKVKDDELLSSMLQEDKELLKKRKGFLGLW